jgi:hypothetical protein
MDNNLRQLMHAKTPPVNDVICKSVAAKHFESLEQYISDVFSSFNKGAPDGVRFVKFEKCSPLEEYHFTTSEKSGKRSFNTARSDIKLYKFYFSFNGKELPPRFVYLPFVDEHGIINLNGTPYLITAIVTDKIISPNKNTVFVRLLRDKVIFKKLLHPVVSNNVTAMESIVYSEIYRQKKIPGKRIEKATRAVTSLAHYLLAKYGLTGTFQRYLGITPIVGTEDINEETYPQSEYVIFGSTGIKPKSFIGRAYSPPKLRIAIRKELVSSEVRSFVAGLYYVIDHFPARFVTPDDLENTKLYMVMLGYIIFKGIFGENKLHKGIEEHFVSLDDYMDNFIKIRLNELGYEVNDFYDLLSLVIKNFNYWLLDTDSLVTMFNKEVSVLYHVLFPITSALFRVNFRLNKLATRKVLTEKEVVDMIHSNIKTGLVYALTKSHVSASSVSYSGDNMVFKLSTTVNVSTVSNNISKAKETDSYLNPRNRIHVSLAYVNGHLTVSKRSERGTGRFNIYATLDDNYTTTVTPPKFKELINRTQELFYNKNPNKL